MSLTPSRAQTCHPLKQRARSCPANRHSRTQARSGAATVRKAGKASVVGILAPRKGEPDALRAPYQRRNVYRTGGWSVKETSEDHPTADSVSSYP